MESTADSQPYVADKNVPLKNDQQLKAWQADIKQRFAAAQGSLDKAKISLSSSATKSRPELLATISTVEEAMHDVSERQLQAAEAFQFAFAILDGVQRENVKLQGEKSALEVRQKAVEERERLWSLGFFAAVGVVLATLAAALPKWTTMFLDRDYRKLEIEQKRAEIANLTRGLS